MLCMVIALLMLGYDDYCQRTDLENTQAQVRTLTAQMQRPAPVVKNSWIEDRLNHQTNALDQPAQPSR